MSYNQALQDKVIMPKNPRRQEIWLYSWKKNNTRGKKTHPAKGELLKKTSKKKTNPNPNIISHFLKFFVNSPPLPVFLSGKV